MARKTKAPQANQKLVLECIQPKCPNCGQTMWSDYNNDRTIRTLLGLVRLTLKVRRCPNRQCENYHQVYRPEAEGRWALPGHEFGLDVIAYAGSLRYQEQRSVPQIHRALRQKGVDICQRSVSNILDRYDELLSVSVTDKNRIKKLLGSQQQVILAIDGLQPQVGQEVLWVIRDCISESILLARSLLSSRGEDISQMLCEVVEALPQSIIAVVSDAQPAIRKAVAIALPNKPHQLCHYHYYKEAFKPITEADRHAKKAYFIVIKSRVYPKLIMIKKQVFGSFRHHQRRTTGRKKAPASMFIRGSARLIATVATRLKTFTAQDLALVDLDAWRHQRSQLESLRQTRLQQRHFRRDPDNYLLELETKLLQSILPL